MVSAPTCTLLQIHNIFNVDNDEDANANPSRCGKKHVHPFEAILFAPKHPDAHAFFSDVVLTLHPQTRTSQVHRGVLIAKCGQNADHLGAPRCRNEDATKGRILITIPNTPWDCHRTADQLGWFWGSMGRHIYIWQSHGVFGYT